MRDVIVVMRDGRVICGPLWEFKPAEGWLSLAGDVEPLQLKDILSAVEKDVMTQQGVVQDVDLLVRAVDEGWRRIATRQDLKDRPLEVNQWAIQGSVTLVDDKGEPRLLLSVIGDDDDS